MKKIVSISSLICAATLFTACGKTDSANNDVSSEANTVTPAPVLTVYSARKEHLIKPLFDAYNEKTGVKIQYITLVYA